MVQGWGTILVILGLVLAFVITGIIATGAAAQSTALVEILVAARQGDIETIETLLAAGVYIDVQDQFRQTTPLIAAAQHGEAHTVWYLLRKGASANSTDIAERSAVMYAARYAGAGMIQDLIDFGADANIVDIRGMTPLMVAAAFGCCDSVESLLAAGADVNASCKGGFCAYDYAVASGNEKVSDLLAHVSMP